MLPLILARRDGPEVLRRATTILRSRPDAEQRWLETQTPGWEISLRTIRIDVYDLGMAIMNGIFRIRPPRGHPLNATARLVKRLVWLKPDPEAGVCSPIAETFRQLADETTREFETAVRVAAPHTIQRPWLSPFLDALARAHPSERARPDDWGRLLWLHPVHMVLVRAKDDLAPVAEDLAAPFHRSLDVLDGRFVPGIGWSVLAKTRDLADTNIPLRLIELQWAYMALYMEIDRGLLALLDSDRWEEEASLAALEDDADNVFADFMRVMEGRARVDSVLATLGGDEQAIWELVADVTKFGALIDGVDRKVDVLQRVAERRVQQAAAAQARRTSAILSFLTALTLVTVTVALLGNFLGTRSDVLGHIEIRVLSVAAALLASIGLYREAFREQPRRRRKRRRKRAPRR